MIGNRIKFKEKAKLIEAKVIDKILVSTIFYKYGTQSEANRNGMNFYDSGNVSGGTSITAYLVKTEFGLAIIKPESIIEIL